MNQQAAHATDERRRFERHEIRGRAKLEPLDEQKTRLKPIDINLWEVGLNGIKFRSPINLEQDSSWRIRIIRDGHLIAHLPISVRNIKQNSTGDYFIGALYLIEPAILAQLGVPVRSIQLQGTQAADQLPSGDFEAPE